MMRELRMLRMKLKLLREEGIELIKVKENEIKRKEEDVESGEKTETEERSEEGMEERNELCGKRKKGIVDGG